MISKTKPKIKKLVEDKKVIEEKRFNDIYIVKSVKYDLNWISLNHLLKQKINNFKEYWVNVWLLFSTYCEKITLKEIKKNE